MDSFKEDYENAYLYSVISMVYGKPNKNDDIFIDKDIIAEIKKVDPRTLCSDCNEDFTCETCCEDYGKTRIPVYGEQGYSWTPSISGSGSFISTEIYISKEGLEDIKSWNIDHG